MEPFEDPVSSDVLLILQFRTVNDPWLPRLRVFECEEIMEELIPFVPLFLSPRTTKICFGFSRTFSTMAVASMIGSLSTLCPDLESITLEDLPSDPAITEAVSEMLLVCNQDTLQVFQVESPLSEEAREVVYRLPRLSTLRTMIEGNTSLPTIALPNLTLMSVEYDDDLDWLQGFRGATLGKLESVTFSSESDQIVDFLATFGNVALTISAQNTISRFKFNTSASWNPDYSSLLSFNQLKTLDIETSCDLGCSSKVDDDLVMSLARAMPKLETLRLGDEPCRTPTGVTIDGLISLAHHCLRLSELRVHLQATSLVEATNNAATQCPSGEHVRREDCALTVLDVGDIPIPAQSTLEVTLALLQIFPRILSVNYTNPDWEAVERNINCFRRIGVFVQHSSKIHPSHLY